ncbi:MAG: type II secretion system F family protein [Pseudomonadota bacterium]
MQLFEITLAKILTFAQEHEAYILALAFFGALASIFLLVNRLVELRERVRSRAIAFNPIEKISGSDDIASAPFSIGADVQGKLEQASELLYKIERGLGDGKELKLSHARRELVQAGYFNSSSVFWFYFSRMLLSVVLGTIPWIIITAYEIQASPLVIGISCLFGALVGLIAPGIYLSYRQGIVRRECRMGFPDFLDLLVVCAQAGIPPRAAFERISRDLALPYPYLGANLFLSYLQIRAGLPVVDAIESLGRRINLQEIRSFGLLLKQTEDLGTKLSDALRVYSHDMRSKRMLRAEEKAHALPVKLTLPLALFIFPVMMVVIFVPIIIRIKQAMF